MKESKRIGKKIIAAQLFAGRWQPKWDALLVDRGIPLEKRLSRFYGVPR